MLPSNLQAANFAAYPPEAKRLATSNLVLLRSLPLSFLPSLLREVMEYDYKFPAEQASISHELGTLNSLAPALLQHWFRGFSQLTVPAKLERLDWINFPGQFVEQQSAQLWSAHQLDAFRLAAKEYGDRLQSARPVDPMRMIRLGICVVGQGVANWNEPLFRNLRAYGTYFANVKPEKGLALLLTGVAERAKIEPVPYGHWYIDGGQQNLSAAESMLTCISYKALDPARAALLKRIDAEVERPGMGPEELHSGMARLLPSDLGIGADGDGVLARFQVKLLTDGSGAQIFSTTFVQWATREALRRAQPLTILARFAPRQRQRPMSELLSSTTGDTELDPAGSLVDSNMGAYYHWINQQRLQGSDRSAFLVWFEGHQQALVISPTLSRGTESKSAYDLGELLSLATT